MRSQYDLLEIAIPLEEKTAKDMNREGSCLQIEAQVSRRMGNE